jgi:stress response protein YsnF
MTDKSATHVLPLTEEELKIDKRSVVTGRVRVRTRVELVDETAQAELERVTVEVTRVPVDRVVTEVPVIRTEGDLTIIPVVEEVLLVEKQLVLKEEIHLRRLIDMEAVSLPVQVRKQHAEIERLEVNKPSQPEKHDE